MVTLRGATDHEIAEEWRLFATGGSPADAHGATGTTGNDGHAPVAAPGEDWPDGEAVAVVAALRLLVELPSGTSDGHRRAGMDTWANRVAERSGRQWAAAHRSARVMWERLLALPAVLAEAAEPDQGLAIERSVRTIADHATDEALHRLEQAALVDPLTGAGNRRALYADLTRALAQAGRFEQRIALVMVDLDGLKETNDRDGHAAGDRALASLADAFRSHLRAADAFYRIGGDEFVAVLVGASASDVPELLGRVAASAPSFSWGTAATSDGATRIADLLGAADADLYQRRRSARSGAALVLVGGTATSLGRAGSVRPASERARLRARAASAAIVAGLALAGGTAPLVETGVLHSALPPRPGVVPAPPRDATGPVATSGSSRGATAAVPPPTPTPVPATPVVAHSPTSAGSSSAPAAGSDVAVSGATVALATASRVARTVATGPAPTATPAARSTPATRPPATPPARPGPPAATRPGHVPPVAATPGRGAVGTVVTAVATTVNGVVAVAVDLVHAPDTRHLAGSSSAGVDRGAGSGPGTAAERASFSPRQGQAGRTTPWRAWRSRSRGR